MFPATVQSPSHQYMVSPITLASGSFAQVAWSWTGTWKSFASGGVTSNLASSTLGSGWMILIVAGLLSEFLWITSEKLPATIVPSSPTPRVMALLNPPSTGGGVSGIWRMPGLLLSRVSVVFALGAVGIREQPVSAAAKAAMKHVTWAGVRRIGEALASVSWVARSVDRAFRSGYVIS